MTYRTVDDYLRLPYTIHVTHDVSNAAGAKYDVWFARVVELPGCMTEADSLEELRPLIEDAMRAWIGTALADGKAVPEPQPAT